MKKFLLFLIIPAFMLSFVSCEDSLGLADIFKDKDKNPEGDVDNPGDDKTLEPGNILKVLEFEVFSSNNDAADTYKIIKGDKYTFDKSARHTLLMRGIYKNVSDQPVFFSTRCKITNTKVNRVVYNRVAAVTYQAVNRDIMPAEPTVRYGEASKTSAYYFFRSLVFPEENETLGAPPNGCIEVIYLIYEPNDYIEYHWGDLNFKTEFVLLNPLTNESIPDTFADDNSMSRDITITME